LKIQQTFPVLEIAFCCVLLFPTPSLSQRPQLAGKLTVTSTPPGAGITIDNQVMGQSTPFTFVVSPGDHRVAVKSADLTNCGTKRVSLVAGSAVSLNCGPKGWDNPNSK
jgi:hypothetical protein